MENNTENNKKINGLIICYMYMPNYMFQNKKQRNPQIFSANYVLNPTSL